jgi:hypothetical protein
MLGSATLVIWYLGTALELSVVVCSLARRSFLRYFFLNVYMLLSVLTSVGRWYLILSGFGVSTDQYRYFYFYTDALLTLALYVAVISLFADVLGELHFAKHLRLSAVVLLLGTAAFSYSVVAQSADRLSTDFAYQLSQNLYFVGLVLTYLLWGAVLKLRETRTRLVQFILSLGLYFSACAASYALKNFTDRCDDILKYVDPLLGCLLPLAWSLTIVRHTEETRLAPASLVVVPR